MKLLVLFVCLFFCFSLAAETKVTLSHHVPAFHNEMKEKILLAFSAHCEPEVLKNWSCYWCKKTKPVKYITHFDFKDSLAFGYIGETEDKSLKKKILTFFKLFSFSEELDMDTFQDGFQTLMF
jgi:hypothetical protein